MMFRRFVVFLLIALSAPRFAAAQTPAPAQPPRLVVGIVVDQMRFDYLTRFGYAFGEDGFKRLLREGTEYRSMHYNYVPTATGPGHAAVWSGAYPANSGIAGNDFWDRKLGQKVYCVSDPAVDPVGTTADEGRRSPHRLLASTVGDELKLTTNQRGLVFGISLKDRASILPAGHFPDGAFWFDYETGRFITSTYYMKTLPDWVTAYNARGRATALIAQPWTLRDPAASYAGSIADDNAFEEAFTGESKPVFPHDIPAIAARMSAAGKEPFDIIATTPSGNTVVRELAEAALEHTALGRDEVPDVLALSFSSTDYVGHRFGPTSLELEDTYRRLDDELAHLFATIDRTVGLKNTVIFLTADHAAAYNAPYLRSLRLDTARTVSGKALKDGVAAALATKYGPAAGAWVFDFLNRQIYLDRPKIRAAGLELAAVEETVRAYLQEQDGIADVVTEAQLRAGDGDDGVRRFVRNGAHRDRSGDVFCIFEPGVMLGHELGTDHGMPWGYDTHVPFIIRGPGIAAGATNFDPVVITQIAPTVAALLHITEPNAAFEPVLPGIGR